ncbi:MAG: chemotaxis protein CheA [Lachnospiraceae bacterium]|jgi:two-component system chemotaxis sensor kinase CheA|nr:chemotaxis protein CheA [Lachnospiraceae bacterium]
MDNGMEAMLETYLYETNSLLDALDELLVNDEKIGDFSSDDVNEIFRSMHTIKGSSAMMEFNSLSTIAHHIEDLFFYIRDKGIESLDPDHKKELFNLMFRSGDYLRSEVQKVENGTPLSEDKDIDSFANEINGFLKKISGAADEAAKDAPAQQAPGAVSENSGLPDDAAAACFLHIFLDDGLGMENLYAFMIINALQEDEIVFRCYPEDIETNPETSAEIVDSGFYLAFDSQETAEQAEQALKTQAHIRSYEFVENSKKKEAPKPQAVPAEVKPAAPVTPVAPAPQSGPVAPAPAASQAKAPAAHAPVKQSLISVNVSKLDSLLDMVGELVITESMVTSAPELNQLSRDSFDNFMKSARQLHKLTDDLQNIAMSLRMVPISGVFQKMNRIVRDMKQKLNKDVRLIIEGENTEMDKNIVDSIQDPIMHIVRNSMDHGIEETVDERIRAGKDPQGELILSATHTSSEVVITVTDDGQGMDPAKLLAKAADKGLLTKPASEYTKKEALNLIMLPGFSTNQTVTEFSGRGVGMDVVNKNIEAVGGTFSLDSDLGVGTTVTMRIPLTLAIMDGMKVTVGKSIFTIAIANIRQSFKVTPDQIIYDDYGNEMVERMGSFYPIIRLHRFYSLETEVTSLEEGILLWVEANDHSYCIFVDQLIGEQQVVVKPFPTYLNSYDLKNYGISGCTILGDGSISIILDVLGLHSAAIDEK